MTSEIIPKTASFPIEILRELVYYNKETGDLLWKNDGRHKKAGGKIGSMSRGYLHVRINGISLMAHRVAWALSFGCFPSKDIDHINLDKSDNRITNLRLANEVENGYNIPMKSTNKAGFKGVYKCKSTGKWIAECKINKRKHWLGRFNTASEAGSVYDNFARVHQGDFYFNKAKGL